MLWSRFSIVSVCLLVFAACSGGGNGSAPRPRELPPADDARSAPAVVAIDAALPVRPAEVGPIPAASRQLIVGVTADWEADDIELARYEREAGGAWTRVGEPWRATIGHAGLAWGVGLHGEGAPDERAGPIKREGDGKSPAGAFDVTRAFGYAPAPVAGAQLPYTQATRAWRCVDDADSPHYTQIVDEAQVASDWSSAEYMKRKDRLYEWVIVIAHNAAALRPRGSCIFFHVWGAGKGATVGCTAMAKPDIEGMLAWLDPAARPVVVQLPRDVYAAVAPGWGLP